jgi:hypothetical protein
MNRSYPRRGISSELEDGVSDIGVLCDLIVDTYTPTFSSLEESVGFVEALRRALDSAHELGFKANNKTSGKPSVPESDFAKSAVSKFRQEIMATYGPILSIDDMREFRRAVRIVLRQAFSAGYKCGSSKVGSRQNPG